MFFEVFVYCIVCILLCLFLINNYRKIQRAYVLCILSLQIIAVVVQMTRIISGVNDIGFYMKFYIFVFGIFFPSLLFFADYAHINVSEYFDIKIGDKNMKNEKYEKAIKNYQKALIQNSENADTFVKLGRAFNAIGDKRTAFDRFARAVELNRNDYRSYYEIGLIFNEMGKKKDAEIMLDNSLRIKPDFTKASELLAEVLCSSNKFDEAINVYKEAIKYAPDDYNLFYKMGIIHTELRDFNEALDCYKSVVNINPEYSEAYFSLGQIYLLKGEFDNSIEAFQNASNDRDIAARAFFQMARAYILKGNEIEAVESIQKAIDIDPTYIYKAEKEPMFNNITEYLEGMQLISTAQTKLEQEIDKKVKEKYEKEYSEAELEKASFNYFDKFNS